MGGAHLALRHGTLAQKREIEDALPRGPGDGPPTSRRPSSLCLRYPRCCVPAGRRSTRSRTRARPATTITVTSRASRVEQQEVDLDGSKFAIANAIRMIATIAMRPAGARSPTGAARAGSLRPRPDPSGLARLEVVAFLVASPPSVTPISVSSHHPAPCDARSVLRAVALAGAALAVGAWSSAGPGRELDLEAFRAGNRDRGPAADRVPSRGDRARLDLGVGGRGRRCWRPRATAGRPPAACSRRRSRGSRAGAEEVFGRPRPYDAEPDGMHLRIGTPNGDLVAEQPPRGPAHVPHRRRDGTSGSGRPRAAALDALAGAIGASRVYVGVHFPSDVVGGVLVGKAVAAVFDGAPSTATRR